MFEELIKIGLSENEARVYLALLELGSAVAQEIAKKADVNRPTTYVQLESLSKMGLVSSFEKQAKRGGAEKTFFRAEDPEHLEKVILREKSLAQDKESVLKKALPQLARLFSFAGDRPKVRFFEGVEGLKTMQDEFLKMDAKEAVSISNADNILKIFPTHPETHTPRRVKKGIHTKLIYTSTRGPFLKATDTAMLRETKFLSPDKFPFSCDVVLHEDKIHISTLNERPVGIIIQDKDIAASMRAWFDALWVRLQ